MAFSIEIQQKMNLLTNDCLAILRLITSDTEQQLLELHNNGVTECSQEFKTLVDTVRVFAELDRAICHGEPLPNDWQHRNKKTED